MVVVIATTLALMHFLLSIVSEAHCWIDCIDTKRSTVYDESMLYIFGGASGDGHCHGYGAHYPGRGNGDIGIGYTHKMLKNEVEAGTPVCKSFDGDAYSGWRKRISIVPGQEVFFGYMPNGHIAKDKKAIGTQYGIYWTAQAGTSLTSTLEMKPEHLLNGRKMNFDDGNCGESLDYNGKPSGRAGDGKPCVGTFTIPAGTTLGIYKLVWYWTFWLDDEASYTDQVQAKGYFGAAYSTCFEVEVISDGSGATKAGAAPVPALEAPVTPAPVASTKFLPSNPIAGAAAPKFSKPAAGATLDFRVIAPKTVDDSDDDGVPPSKYGLKGVATMNGALQSSSNSSDSFAASGSTTDDDDDDDLDVRQEEPSAPSTAVSAPSSTSDPSSKSTSSTMKQGSSANYIKTSEGWLVLGVALLLGALV
ncbi:unnamed protein product [Peronospora destructor]|uniref:DUF7492 domain-containing protein n=1 Tax=Peronospora destructor TaxID=86335 RepID=A0AAV0U3L4_9STRA|nr:unnamed protein product [Peronospora destructor]